MSSNPVFIRLASPDATTALAERMAGELCAGDTLLLSGPVGAGKTHFARRLIQSMQDMPEDVPSPTFTLVQTYDTRAGTLWHTDLYRIGQVQEIEELGLIEAFGSAICLVEWPEVLGPWAPPDALSIDFAHGPDDAVRELTISWAEARWADRVTTWSANQ